MKESIALINQYWTDIYFHLHYAHKDKITHQAIRILQLVEKQERIGVGEVASYLDVSHNTASEHIKRLIEKDCLSKERDKKDERKVILRLTDEGKRIVHRNTSLDVNKLEKVLSDLNEDEKKNIQQAMQILSEHAKQCT
ncbi:MarR family winged helix-turn-helix transcriptional regulator [Cytobacillus purgationiresistens]|uniref:HTH-type transcriptional regulator SarZ n=1 Tax=Cytobacillus purgationiresistens TaxID=863449 RepID=A0ABU0ANH2_9BACI|nr:MarR family transcriptional regulator [Cytobacillus purgationiresistens]MDQ0272836.1 DNA-binding MarR family transcriptional regulator [Cytobacillus purgationiresistens]